MCIFFSDEHKTVLSAPKFRNPNKMQPLYLKPVGNFIRLKCVADGKKDFNLFK